jgi:putative phosphoribosyl transferase
MRVTGRRSGPWSAGRPDRGAAPFFADRAEAGRLLAQALAAYRGDDTVVLGLPRGGVPVAAAVADALHVPLDVIVVRKLGVPYAPELALGAIGERDVRVLNESVLRSTGLSPSEVQGVERRERAELDRRVRLFRPGAPPAEVAGRTAIVVDDGVATGATARAACLVVRALSARRVVLAVPVASPRALAALEEVADEEVADEVVCLVSPADLTSVGAAYRDFRQVHDQEVVDTIARTRRAAAGRDRPSPAATGEERATTVEIPAAGVRLPGTLVLPRGSRSVVLFAHGSGSSRLSPRNRYVARRLGDAGLGTLLFDLLTPVEEQDRRRVFDIALLGERLLEATRWLQESIGPGRPAVGYFGASTGAAAALWAAADPSVHVGAVVSRGGRPDLAAERLRRVTAPTLLVVGGRDHTVLELNRRAQASMTGEVRLTVVPGAGHLFEEPGALEEVADLSTSWFTRHLSPGRASWAARGS